MHKITFEHATQLNLSRERRFEMPRINYDVRKSVILLESKGYSIPAIHERLKEQGISITKRSLYRLSKKFRESKSIMDLPRQKRTKKLTTDVLKAIDEEMENNDELTARQLRSRLQERFPSLSVSLSAIKLARKQQGWVCTKPHYCQLIRENNVDKCLKWCQEQLTNEEDFSTTIFTDECTVQLENHSKICFRKKRQQRALKQRPKHPIKVHIWGGISYKGATKIIIFTGIMNAPRYVKIL